MTVRLQKFLADAGVASRRASEEIIRAGRVAVNGKVLTELGTKVDPAHDRVTLDGKPLKTRRKLYIALHKPPGFISSRNDPQQRPSLHQLLPLEWGDLYSVGRLDFKSEGLIFLTNDGEFALRLTHPRYGVEKKYLVSVRGPASHEALRELTKGIFLEGELLKAERARIVHKDTHHTVVEMILREGKNREIRRMFDSLDLKVEKLQRVQIGPIKLGELPRGKWRTLTAREIESLIGPTKRNLATRENKTNSPTS